MLQAADLPRHWQKPLLGLLLATLACIAIFWETWNSIVAIWSRSDTFAHGFIVAPISLWLIWMRRNQYRHLQPAASPLGLFGVACFGFIWLTANIVHVLVVQQWAVVGVLLCSFWAILGTRTARTMLFPLLFLFLMVPFGEDFVPYLMEYTATFVVWMLRLTGISVYREGLHFTLTSGNWSVVDACSGIRYLIASITLGLVFAYLNFSSYVKRAWFILAAILTPILANGLRAYMIVMIGHLSDMKLATGVDHIIYGWVFFGIVMLLLFYVGSFWQDPVPSPAPAMDADVDNGVEHVYPHIWTSIAALLACLAIWPLGSLWMTSHQAGHVEIPEHLTHPPASDWQSVDAPDWGWEPKFQGLAAQAKNYVGNGGSVSGLYAANFDNDTQGGELINSQHVLVTQKEKLWRIVHTGKTRINWPGGPVDVDESVLGSRERDLLVLRWYRIGSENSANSYYAKWLQLLKRFSGDASPELLMVLYTETPHGDYRQARERLQRLAEACCGQ